MLKDNDVYATIPVSNLEETRKFYEDKLGLEVAEENPAGVFYRAGSSRMLLFKSAGKANGSHTQAGWRVDDLDAEVANLQRVGVKFEEYDFPGLKTVNGIADMGGIRAAWFKDPEGNLFGIAQYG
jgi:catechol 2,3-dioxygenase-like lactoylglutathione lyase family enzyme